ncbi:MAG: WXG100 family type VII secretion target [Dermatophilaceae bacterium]
MPNLNITYGDMNQVASKIRNNKTTIDTTLTETRTMISDLVASGFVTEKAGPRFDEKAGEFDSSAKTTMETLAQLSQWLDSAVTALQDADTQIASALEG